jgi:hypothetical protein
LKSTIDSHQSNTRDVRADGMKFHTPGRGFGFSLAVSGHLASRGGLKIRAPAGEALAFLGLSASRAE